MRTEVIMEPGVVEADGGAFVRLRKLGVRYLIRGEQTGGRFAVVEHPLPPHSMGSPVHTHTREDEITYVAEGTVGVQIGDKVYEAGPGVTIRKPRGIPHAFWNAGDTPARLSEISRQRDSSVTSKRWRWRSSLGTAASRTSNS